jgi:hypothetical protein
MEMDLTNVIDSLEDTICYPENTVLKSIIDGEF